jgi:hypothetical protein
MGVGANSKPSSSIVFLNHSGIPDDWLNPVNINRWASCKTITNYSIVYSKFKINLPDIIRPDVINILNTTQLLCLQKLTFHFHLAIQIQFFNDKSVCKQSVKHYAVQFADKSPSN